MSQPRNTDRRQDENSVSQPGTEEERRQGDRRRSSRLDLELWMEEVAGDAVFFRRSGNISMGGVFFEQAIPHAIDTSVTLRFSLPQDGGEIRALGTVVNAEGAGDSIGMGVRFNAFEADGEARLRAYLEHASAEQGQ